jgi:hypothetical protein
VARLSKGSVVTDDSWKTSFIDQPPPPPSQPIGTQYIRKPNAAIAAAAVRNESNQDHPGYKNLAAAAAAGQQSRKDERDSKLVKAGPSDESILKGKDDANARANAKLNIPTPPPFGVPTRPRMNPRTLKHLPGTTGSGGGNKQRTRKRQRIARAHHHTKRRLSSNSKPANHKHTRKARLVRASGSV